MSDVDVGRVVLLIVGAALVGVAVGRSRASQERRDGLARTALAVVAGLNILLLTVLVLNHINFPLSLEVMEGTVLQHFRRAVSLQAIYPEPSPAFVPLAYNPLYYVVSIPFGWVFGVSLFTLRLVAVLGLVGSGLLLYRIVRDKTGSAWWAFLAVGLFAAAYRVMDAYLDTAHSDSWLLFSALLGSYLIDRDRSRAWNVAGVIVLAASFWFKQHGAMFAVGGVLFLTWREIVRSNWRAGLRRSIPYWGVAALLGPALYVLGGPLLFGPRFLYFTWEVPRQWTVFNLDTVYRFGVFIIHNYLILSLAGGLLVLWTGLRERANLNVWHVQFVLAVLTGLMGALDAGSSDNVLVPMGTWFILVGTLSLFQLSARLPVVRRYGLHLLALFFTLATFLYDPRPQIVPADAQDRYHELITFVDQLGGQVYAPDIGQLPDGYTLYPTPHWVALEDMIRGPGRDRRDHPTTRRLIDPVINPEEEPSYILAYFRLEDKNVFEFLLGYYTLEADLGERFRSLKTTPHRWDSGYPRYLYRYNPEAAISGQ